MREIRFRGKRIDNGEWVYGDLIQLYDGRKFISISEVITETIGQHTGLKYKNGKEIYEGDIVLVNRYDLLSTSWNSEIENEEKILIMRRVGYVVYDELRLSFRVKSPVSNQTVSLSGVGYFDYDVEIIGNIYDNPELLKEV